jgi:small-conductance mechanosensitive channel
MRIIIAGILGGIALFIWGGIWHEVLPFQLNGLRSLPTEQALETKAKLPDAGVYISPGYDVPDAAPFAIRLLSMRKLARKPPDEPRQFLVYHPVTQRISARPFVVEFLTNIVQALIAGFLVAQARLRRYSSRLGFIVVLGVLASITTNISFSNFYGFPIGFVTTNMIFLAIGYLIVGLIVAAIVKTPVSKATV